MTDRMTEDRMIFAASCVESAARELDIPAREMYRRMKRVNLVEDYILKHYGSIHTESRKHITEDIVGCLLDWEKTNLFKKYGNKPTFQNQLDYIWYELNSTHKNGLKMLRKSKTVDEAAANALGYYEFSAGPEGAMRALDRTGKNTKWKNPPGSEVMLKGQNYARGLMGMDPLDSYQGYTADVPVKVVPSPMDMAVPNPVAYNPVDYSAMIKPMEVPGLGDAAYVPKEDNNLGLIKLMQDMGYFGSQPSQPLESYVPDAPQEEESLFNMSAPSPQNTMLDGSWFAKGGHLYGGGSELSNDSTEDNTTYNAGFLPEVVVTPPGGYLHEQMIADDYITQYNDNLLTSYDGRPLTVINPGLSRRFQKGANERNEWRKAHPYRAFGDDALTYGLGLAPLWAGAGLGLASAGEAYAGSALAANIAKGWTGLTNTVWFPWVDGAATALGAAHGGSEILKGNGSPENVLEVMPMGQAVKPMYNLGKRIYNAGKSAVGRYAEVLPVRALNTKNSVMESMPVMAKENAVPASNLGAFTSNDAEAGRQAFLQDISSPWYKERWMKEGIEEDVADNIISYMYRNAETVPFDLSKNSYELDAYGLTTPNQKVRTLRRDGNGNVAWTRDNYDTGLNISIASDNPDKANTAYHELFHYTTDNSKGINYNVPDIIIEDYKNPFSRIEYNFPEIRHTVITKTKPYDDTIMRQNDRLLPKKDSFYEMALDNPEEFKKTLISAGRTPEYAEAQLKDIKDDYKYMWNLQEQRAWLKTFFKEKIQPYIKNPNDAAEIEKYLNDNPNILKEAPKEIRQVMHVLRPGSVKDYAKYFAGSLGIAPVVNTLNKE